MPELPDVTQAFEADTTQFSAALDDLIAKLEEFAAAVDGMQEKLVGLGETADDVAVMLEAAAERSNDLADATAKAGAGADAAANRLSDYATSAAAAAAADGLLNASLDSTAARMAGVAVASTAAGNSANTTRRIFGLTTTALHWIISGSAELAAVLIPATVAAGAWAFAWAQGAGNVYEHMEALYTVTEAWGQASGKTMGELLGLKGVWQQVQNEANVDVYQALGAGINLVKESFGGLAQVGLQMGRDFDTFAAKVVYDFSSAGRAGSELGTLLAHMGNDLERVGDVFVNLGAAVAAFAAQMPGLAEVLLNILSDLLGFVKVVTEFASVLHIGSWSVLTFVMALEEFNRWGSLVAGLFTNMGLGTAEVTGGFLSLGRAAGILRNVMGLLPALVSQLGLGLVSLGGKMGAAGAGIQEAGAAMAEFGTESQFAIAGLSTGWVLGITAAAVALGFLVDKMVTYQDQAQKMVAAMQKEVTAANDLAVLSDIGNNLTTLGDLSAKTADQISALNDAQSKAAASGTEEATQIRAYQVQMEAARSSAALYSAAQVQQVQDAANVVTGAGQIARAFGVSVPAAMALAQSAGVNLTGEVMNQKGQWTALGEKVNDAVSGYKAMGVAGAGLGNSMLAVAIATGEAATKMQTLNQDWDAFMQDMTGGTSAAAGFTTAMSQIGSVVASTSNTLSASASISLNTKQFAAALNSAGTTGAAAWTNLDQVIGSTAPQMIDWLRTAASMGATTGAQVQQAGLDMVAGLIPYVAQSRTAQAETLALAKDAGVNVTTFPQLQKAVQAAGATTSGYNSIVDQATMAMNNMAGDAENLGNVMSSDYTTAISQAALKSSGFDADTTNLAEAIKKYGADSPQAAAATRAVTSAWNQAQAIAGEMAGKVNDISNAIRSLPDKKTVEITVNMTGSGVAYLGSTKVSGGGGASYSLTATGYVGRAAGGYVDGPGTKTSDSILTRLSKGEFVMRADAVDHWGTHLLHAMNTAKPMAAGGVPGNPGSPASLLTLAAGGGDTHLHNTTAVNVTLNGAPIAAEVRSQQAIFGRRNPGAMLGAGPGRSRHF